MATATPTPWKMKGTVLVACNCDYGCPCNFKAPPSHGKCEGGWTWHVREGSCGDTELDGLNFSIYVNWPGAIHEGNGEALILIDERADDRQREAIATLVKVASVARGAFSRGRGQPSTAPSPCRT
jgi:hypothetical protein